MRYSSASKYISGIKQYSNSFGHSFDIPPLAHSFAKKWRRQDNSKNIPIIRKDKLTKEMLDDISIMHTSKLPSKLKPFHDTFIGISYFSLYSLARLGEVVVQKPTVGSLKLDKFATLIIPQTKSDVHKLGAPLSIPRDVWDNQVAPRLYLHKLTDNDYIFTIPGKTFNKQFFISWLREALLLAGYNQTIAFAGHSFRRGGAQLLFDLGNPIEFITSKGRWISDSWKVYIDVSRRPLTY